MSIFRFDWNWPAAPRKPAPAPLREPETPPEPLCRTCLRGQMLRGFEPGQDTVTCNLTGVPWFVPFPVRECNEYVARRTVKPIAGFNESNSNSGETRKEST